MLGDLSVADPMVELAAIEERVSIQLAVVQGVLQSAKVFQNNGIITRGPKGFVRHPGDSVQALEAGGGVRLVYHHEVTGLRTVAEAAADAPFEHCRLPRMRGPDDWRGHAQRTKLSRCPRLVQCGLDEHPYIEAVSVEAAQLEDEKVTRDIGPVVFPAHDPIAIGRAVAVGAKIARLVLELNPEPFLPLANSLVCNTVREASFYSLDLQL